MRYKILLSVCLFTSLSSLAQTKPDKAFAIVGSNNGNFNWINIQEIDLTTGELTRRVYDKEKTVFELVDGKTKKKLLLDENKMLVNTNATNKLTAVNTSGEVVKLEFKSVNGSGEVVKHEFKSVSPEVYPKAQDIKEITVTGDKPAVNNANPNMVKSRIVVRKMVRQVSGQRVRNLAYEYPTASMVAAAAYDQRHNKLYFTPMHFGELRWIDLYDKSSTLKVFCLTDELLTPKEIQNETTQITRMVIAADGNGYALSNDANHFIRFSTGKKPDIVQLGALKDNAENNSNSVHGRNMYGGDIIADAFGGLYLVTASANVFRIDINKLEATHIGRIEGLPQRYTTNGAAVNINGDVIVSSANSNEGYFKVDLNSLKAEKLESKNQPNSSDLATGNFAFDKRKKELSNAALKNIDLTMSNGRVTVFPNPVRQGFFNVNFKESTVGQYDVQLVDLSGKIVFQRRVNVGMKNQTENVVLDRALSNGVYTVKIVDRSKKILSTGNIVLQ